MGDSNLERRKQSAAKALARAWLGADEAKALVDYAVEGAIQQTLDTIAGATSIPSTMTAARAERLLYICRAAGRWFSQREVEVLFRVTPATARSIMGTAQAVYEADLDPYLAGRMRSTVAASPAGTVTVPKIRLRCPDASTYNVLKNEVYRLGLGDQADEGPGKLDITLPETVTAGGRKRSVFDVLTIPKPASWPER